MQDPRGNWCELDLSDDLEVRVTVIEGGKWVQFVRGDVMVSINQSTWALMYENLHVSKQLP